MDCDGEDLEDRDSLRLERRNRRLKLAGDGPMEDELERGEPRQLLSEDSSSERLRGTPSIESGPVSDRAI